MRKSKNSIKIRILRISRRLFVVSSLFFVIFLTQWLTTAATAIEFPSSGSPPTLFSNQTGTDLQLLFCDALSSAKSSIFLEVYAITDPSILSILQNKSNYTSVDVLADGKASPRLSKKLQAPLHLSLHKGQGLMHRKVVVIDDELVLLGSTNFTKPSLQMHDNLVIAVREKPIAKFFQQKEQQHDVFGFPGQNMEIWKLPASGKESFKAICDALQTAQKTIKVAMFTFTHPTIAGELVAAKNRGVDVRVVLDHYTLEGSSKKVADTLQEHGIPVIGSKGMQLMHHKWALIDDELLFTGSINWTKNAFARNKEIALIITPLTESQKEEMLDIWQALQ